MLVVTHTNICSSVRSTVPRGYGFTAYGMFSYRLPAQCRQTRSFGTMLSPGTFLAPQTEPPLHKFRTIVKHRNHYEFEARVHSCAKLCTTMDEQRRNRGDFDAPSARRIYPLTALLGAHVSADTQHASRLAIGYIRSCHDVWNLCSGGLE